MISELKEIQCTPKNLKSFGLILGGLLLAVAAAGWWNGRPSYPYWLAAGLLIFSAGAVYPLILRPVYKAWMSVAMLIGWVLTRIILTFLFYAILTPLGIINRLTGKNILSEKPKNQNTYWIKRTSPRTKEQYENQF